MDYMYCIKRYLLVICMFCMYQILPFLENPILFTTVKITLITSVVIYGVFPVVFKYCQKVRRGMVFANMIPWPKTFGLHDEGTNLTGYNSFFVHSVSNASNKPLSLGTWHILPSKYENWEETANSMKLNRSNKDEVFEKLLSKGDCPIILYAHGNSFNRAAGHRVSLYNVFKKLDYHCIAFDYRGYGDSSEIEPTEEGVVEDFIVMYKWILEVFEKHNGKCPSIYVWGHSLGTGISSRALAELSKQHSNVKQPDGLILEAPFNNFEDELTKHILGKIMGVVPWFHYTIMNPLLEDGFSFTSDEYIKEYSCPVLILHAKDDFIVPYELGLKLYEAGKFNRPENFGEVEMVSFESDENLGHKYICNAPILPEIIRNFVSKSSTCKS